MIQAMYNGVSGLRAHKTMMDVISNNIANVNTTAYKSERVTFQEAFAQTMKGATAPANGTIGGTNPMQVGSGVGVSSIDTNQNEGTLQSTEKPTDVAVEGNGLFMLSDGQGKFFTRDGSFAVDRAGNLVSASSGYKVLGWTANAITGKIDTSIPIDSTMGIKLPKSQFTRATTNIQLGGNLQMDTLPGQSRTVSSLAYDTLGQAHTISIDLTKQQSDVITQGCAASTSTVGSGPLVVTTGTGSTAPVNYNITVPSGATLTDLEALINNADGGGKLTATLKTDGAPSAPDYLEITSADGTQVSIDASSMTGTDKPVFSADKSNWTWSASENGNDVGGGTVQFDSTGKNPVYTGNISVALQNGAAPMDVAVNFTSVTQLSGQNTLSTVSQDGLPLGTLTTFTVGNDGVISGIFTNGQTQPLAEIALAGFSNPAGLTIVGNNLLVESANSGPAQVGTPDSGSMGKVMGGYLESSNVDLATEFANMIIAQRGFQANSRIISTSDQILQELVQMKQ